MSSNKCFLCGKITRRFLFELNSKKAKELESALIIEKHFGFKPKLGDGSTEGVCTICWNVLLSFHKLYKTVTAAHKEEIMASPDDTFTVVHNYLECNVSFPTDEIVLQPDIKMEVMEVEGEMTGMETNNVCNEEVNEPSKVLQSKAAIMAKDSNGSLQLEFPLSVHPFIQTDEDDNIDSASTDTEEASMNSSYYSIDLKKAKAQDVSNVAKNGTQEKENNVDTPTESEYEPNDDDDVDDDLEPRKTKPKSQACCDKQIGKFLKNLKCHLCKLSFEKFKSLSTHVLKFHKREPLVTCCDLKFSTAKNLADHVLIHLFKCEICGKVVQNNSKLKRHMKTYHSCGMCEETFTGRKALREHKLLKHKNEQEFKYACKRCNAKYPRIEMLRHHLRTVCKKIKNQIKFPCNECGKNFLKEENLEYHLKFHHSKETVKGRVPCKICKTETLYNKKYLRTHMRRMHEKNEKALCTVCDKEFKNIICLKKHIYLQHKRKETKTC